MTFEIELLDDRFDVPEDAIWQFISLYWHINQVEPNNLLYPISKNKVVDDIRTIIEWKGDYDGIPLEITFLKDGIRLIWFGVTYLSEGPFGRNEQILGFIEINRALINSDIPVDVRIVCNWKPFYLYFSGLANALRSNFTKQPIDNAIKEILGFKAVVERQTYKDIFIDGKPQEYIGRSFLQMFLNSRSYREVQVRGGQSDLLAFEKELRILYETKIWRGIENHNKGLREIEEYIIGEDTDNKLGAVFYIIFDPTESAAARRHLGSDLGTVVISKHTVHIIIVNINPPKPSKKKKDSTL